MDLRDQLAVLRSWFLVIAAAAVLAGVAAYIVSVSGVLPLSYEARAKVQVVSVSTNPNVDLAQAAQTQSNMSAEVAISHTFLRAVMIRAGREWPLAEFKKKISVRADPDLPFIEIVATDENPTMAMALANAMAEELIADSEKSSGGTVAEDPSLTQDLATIQRALEGTRARIALLQADRSRTPAEESTLQGLLIDLVTLRQTYATLGAAPAANRLTFLDHPELPNEPVSPRPLFNTAIGVILALLVATAVAFLWERLDDRVRTAEDIERVTGLPTIGTIIRMPSERGRKEFYRLATLLYPRSVAAEAFRSIRTNLEFASLDRPLRTITITSSVPGEGKSVVAGNIAVAFAQAGRRTVLVDADLRRPGLHTLFSAPNAMGLTDMVLSDGMGLANVAQHTEEPNLRIVTSGAVPANPAELLGSQRMAVILQRILADADLVILDTPPIGVVTDAALVAARADATVLVVNPDRSSEQVVQKARETLAHVNARVVGAVLNNVARRDAQANPYYGLYRPEERSKLSPIKLRPRPGPAPHSVTDDTAAAGGSVGESGEGKL